MLPAPTSAPYTFTGVSLSSHIKQAGEYFIGLYWGRRYKIESMLTIYYGSAETPFIEDHPAYVEGCFTRNDPYYEQVYTNCIPQDVTCEEPS